MDIIASYDAQTDCLIVRFASRSGSTSPASTASASVPGYQRLRWGDRVQLLAKLLALRLNADQAAMLAAIKAVAP